MDVSAYRDHTVLCNTNSILINLFFSNRARAKQRQTHQACY